MTTNHLFLLAILAPLGCGSGTTAAPPGEADGPDAAVALDAPEAIDEAVTIRVQASTDDFAHADGLSGMTALAAGGGVRSLSLLTGALDSDPLTLFDHGAEAVQVSYDHGADTAVAVLDRDRFQPGHYTVARLVQAYSLYEIEATRHDGEAIAEGHLSSVVVMSDQSLVDGEMRDAGYYHAFFRHSDGEIELIGDDLHIAEYSSTAGARAVVEDGEWAVYFPIDLTIEDMPPAGSELVLLVNMNRSFRWIDSLALGFEQGVYDFTPHFCESVVRFGGNQFDLGWQ